MFKKYLILLVLISLTLIGFPEIISAQSATLYFSPASGTFTEGESFWVALMVNTGTDAVNALAAYLTYPEDKLQPLGVDTAGSVIEMWAEKNFSGGRIEISGGVPTPGFSGVKKIIALGFKVKVSSGSATLTFSDDSAVVTDAENKDIFSLSTSGEGKYAFIPKPAAPSTPSTPSTPSQTGAKPQPPVISEIAVGGITQSGATIYWKTDQEANAVVEYGFTQAYGSSTTDDQLAKEHSLVISGLSPEALYHFRVKSKTAAGKEAASEDATFSTPAPLPEEKAIPFDYTLVLMILLSVAVVGLCFLAILKIFDLWIFKPKAK